MGNGNGLSADAILGMIGVGTNIFSNWMNNQQIQNLNASNQAHETNLLNLQNEYNEQAAQNADERTRALYNDLQSPNAKLQQLKNAGLSVGLMYGQGGMGGNLASGAQAATATAQNRGTIAPRPLMDVNSANIIANLAKTSAETNLIKSQDTDTQASTRVKYKDMDETDKRMVKMEFEMDKLDAETKETMQNTLNLIEQNLQIKAQTATEEEKKKLTEAQTKYTQSMTMLNQINADTLGEMNQAKINELKSHVKEMDAAAKKLGIENEILDKTKNDLIKKVEYEVAMMLYEKDNIQPQQLEELKAKIAMMKAETGKFESEKARIDWENKKEEEIRNMLKDYNVSPGQATFIAKILQIIVGALVP